MDSPLTSWGRKQARSLESVLPEFDHIFLSPLLRAFDTGLLATGLSPNSKKLTVVDGLQEIDFGTLQGLSYYELTVQFDIIQQHVRFERDVLQGEFNAETHHAFFQRTQKAFNNIIEESERNEWNRVAIFSHGGVLRSILQCHLQLTEGRFENTEIAILRDEYPEKRGNWNLMRITSHILLDQG